MRKARMISNGRAGCGQGKVNMVDVIVKPRKKIPQKPVVQNELSTAISITDFVTDPERPCVVLVIFSRLLSEPEKSKIVALIKAHEAAEILVCSIWQTNGRLRLSIKLEDARDGGCRDARVIMRAAVAQI